MRKRAIVLMKDNWLLLVAVTIAFLLQLISGFSYYLSARRTIYSPIGLSLDFGNAEIYDEADNKKLSNADYGCIVASTEQRLDKDNCNRFYLFGFSGFLLTELTAILVLIGKLGWNKKITSSLKSKRKQSLFWKIFSRGLAVLAFQLLAILPLILIVIAEFYLAAQAENKARDELLAAFDQIIAAPGDTRILTSPEEISSAILKTENEKHILFSESKLSLLAALFFRKADLHNLSYYEKVILFDEEYIFINPNSESVDRKLKEQLPAPLVYFPEYQTLLVVNESLEGYSEVLPALTKHNILAQAGVRNLITKFKNPEISFLSSDDYNEIIKKKDDLIRKKYLGAIQTILTDMAKLADWMAGANDALVRLEKGKSDYESKWGSWSRECKSVLGESDNTCLEGERSLQKNLQDYQQAIDEAKRNMDEAKGYAGKLKVYLSQWNKALENFDKNPITVLDQGGIYFTPNQIYVRFTNDDSAINELSAIIHEFFHYYSDTTGNSLPLFLEEGMTELMANKVKSVTTLKDDELKAYPELTQIASILEEGLGTEKMLEVYFSKSSPKFKSAFSDAYEQKNHKRFLDLGDQLFYAPLNEEISRGELLQEISKLLGKDIKPQDGSYIINYTQ